MDSTINCEVCVLGAGPAGVAAALELAQQGVSDVLVVDANKRAGGLSRTLQSHGHFFDVGPHRFFTKNPEVLQLWKQTLGRDFMPVKRLTRIYYNNKFFLYPISALDALPKLGLVEAGQALVSFLWAKTKNADRAETFEDWVVAKFGKKLYLSFFQTYTEKVWGIPCREIGADWAAQRIKGLDLFEVVKKAFGVVLGSQPKTLVEEFDYPVLGSGMMYERMAELASEKGVRFLFENRLKSVTQRNGQVLFVTLDDLTQIQAKHYISTIPLTRILLMMQPALGREVTQACEKLYYRDHITVNLVVNQQKLFPDQWIYVHSADVKMARLANYANFSSKMARQAGQTPVSIEYFVFQRDPLWQFSDRELIQLATDEIEQMKLIPPRSVEQGFVVRESDSYPTYFLGYEPAFNVAKQAIAQFGNLAPAGRGGLFRYNNMDHSLYSGLLAARNFVAKEPRYDVWQINIDAEYGEAPKRSTPPNKPRERSDGR